MITNVAPPSYGSQSVYTLYCSQRHKEASSKV